MTASDSTPGMVEHKKTGGALVLHWNLVFATAASIVLMVLIFSAVFKSFRPDQFIYLARSFAEGRLSVDTMPLIYPDYVQWNGHVYLPIGPLPAVVLVFFLPLLDLGLAPQWINIIFTVANVWLLYSVCGKLGVQGETRHWTALLFFGGTVYFSIAATMVSWYFAHVLATTLLFAAILETLGRRRPFLIGIIVGMAAATRLTVLFSLPFFLWSLKDVADIPERQLWRQGFTNVAKLVLGLAIPGALLLMYNYARFENLFETGYGLAVVGSSELASARNEGLLSLAHIPRNLYFLLFQGPIPIPSLEAPIFRFPYIQPSPLGMGLFFTSPALLYALKAKVNNSVVKACWSGVASTVIALLPYYGTGWIQFGFRYSLDFMPFLLLIAAHGFPKPLGNLPRILITLSVLINLWGTAWLHSWF